MNLVKAYMEYKRNLILDLIYYLSPDLKDTNSINIIDKFIDTYFQAYYFHSLQTLDKSEKTKYNYSTIKQELYGMKIEIEYDKEYESNLITKIYKLILISIKIIHSMYTLDDLKECISKNKIDVEAEKILKLIEDYNKKEAKFINALTIDDFKLNIILYSNKKDLYKCELVTDINQLTKHYSDISISKNFNNDLFALDKTKITLNLLSVVLIKDFSISKDLDYYFIEISSSLYDEKNLGEIFETIDYPYIKDNIVLLVDLKSYLKNKRLLSKYNYKLGVIVDMSHINEVESKLQSIESLENIDYIVLDKLKAKDYETIYKYESDKEIIINDLVKE